MVSSSPTMAGSSPLISLIVLTHYSTPVLLCDMIIPETMALTKASAEASTTRQQAQARPEGCKLLVQGTTHWQHTATPQYCYTTKLCPCPWTTIAAHPHGCRCLRPHPQNTEPNLGRCLKKPKILEGKKVTFTLKNPEIYISIFIHQYC